MPKPRQLNLFYIMTFIIILLSIWLIYEIIISSSENDGKTDIVITYVDFECVKWQEAYKHHIETVYDPTVHTADSATKNRFVNHGELRYLLRAIAHHMPWIRHVFLVVDDELVVPAWISQEVKIVRHKEIFLGAHRACLPTFNSQAIETVLHKIKGISDPFIYFNDDVFIGRPIQRTDLIQESRIAIIPTESRSKTGIPDVSEYGYRCAWKNVNTLLDNHFGTTVRYKLEHAPFVVSPRIMKKLWKVFNTEMESTVRSQFRAVTDVNVSPALHPYYALHSGDGFIQKNLSAKTAYLSMGNKPATLIKLNDLHMNLPHFFCLEDGDGQSESDGAIKNFFEKIFPENSKYET